MESCAIGRAVGELDHPVDHRLRMHHHVDAVVVEPEQLVGLDHLEALVHERRGVDRDLRAHVPRGVLERVGDRDQRKLLTRVAAERPSARGEDQAPDLVGRAGPQRLVERGVLAVDGNDLARATRACGRDHRATGDQALLVGKRKALAVDERGDRRRKSGEADDRVQHDIGVGVRGELGERVRIAGARTRVFDGNTELDALRFEELGVATGSERHHLVAVAMVPDDFERLGADGTGGAEDDDFAHVSGGCRRPSDDAAGENQVVDGGEAEQHRVEAVEHAAVTRQQRAEVLEPEVALEHRLAEVTERGEDRHDEPEQARRCRASSTDAGRGSRATMAPRITDAAIPASRPSTVLFGDTSGASGRRPMRDPTR